MSEFKPGDMVELIDDSGFTPVLRGLYSLPQKGLGYTVRRVSEDYVWLAEIAPQICLGTGGDCGLGHSRFRIISLPTTNIESLRATVEREFSTASVIPHKENVNERV